MDHLRLVDSRSGSLERVTRLAPDIGDGQNPVLVVSVTDESQSDLMAGLRRLLSKGGRPGSFS